MFHVKLLFPWNAGRAVFGRPMCERYLQYPQKSVFGPQREAIDEYVVAAGLIAGTGDCGAAFPLKAQVDSGRSRVPELAVLRTDSYSMAPDAGTAHRRPRAAPAGLVLVGDGPVLGLLQQGSRS